MIYDTIIVGAGPSGLTAAIYLGRYQRKTLMLGGDLGGQTAIAGMLENFPGFLEINGFELVSKMLEQTKKLDTVETKIGEDVKEINKDGDEIVVKSEKGEYRAKTVLIASGKRHRELGLENEKSLIGKGVSYCATCDGPFARDKDVVIIGGGYAATEAALVVEKVAKSVTIVNIANELSGEILTINKINEKEKITIINNATTREIIEKDGVVNAIEYEKNTAEKKKIEAQMVFVEIGQIPNTEIFKELLDLNESGEIKVNLENATNVEGVFASGDITDIKAKQTIVACGEGAKAAIAINNYLENKF